MARMNKTRLTKRTVEAIEVGEKAIQVMDAELPGFGIRVMPSGVCSYFIRYRNKENRPLRYTIGQHGKITADQARKMAKQLFAEIAAGNDPAGNREVMRKAPKVFELFERFMKEHAKVHNAPSTQRLYERLINKFIVPKLGRLTVGGVERRDIQKLHHAMRGTHRQANQVLSLLSKAFNLAEAWGWRTQGTNPCRYVQKFKEAARDRFLSDDEMKRIGAALDELENAHRLAPGVADVVRLLALTGCRLGEVQQLRWDDVNFERSVFELATSKTGKRDHIVGATTLAFLAALPRVEGCPWVFPGVQSKWLNPNTKIKNNEDCLSQSVIQHAWNGKIRPAAKLEEQDTGLPSVHLHDLRHTVGTYAGQTGANAFLIRDKLGHKTTAMTNRYVNKDNSPVRVLSDQVESRVAAGLFGSKGGEVIPLKRKG
jgi:integrase